MLDGVVMSFIYSFISFLICHSWLFPHWNKNKNSEDLNRGSIQSQQRMRMRDWAEKMRSKGRPCVVYVGRTMHLMSSGFVATYVRSGSMASVWRSLLRGPSTSNSTSVPHAAIRELGLDIIDTWVIVPFLPCKSCWTANYS